MHPYIWASVEAREVHIPRTGCCEPLTYSSRKEVSAVDCRASSLVPESSFICHLGQTVAIGTLSVFIVHFFPNTTPVYGMLSFLLDMRILLNMAASRKDSELFIAQVKAN